MADSERTVIFEDAMFPGVILDKSISLASTNKRYPDYLEVKQTVRLKSDDRIYPSHLSAQCAYIYNDNLYVTDKKGNIAYLDCEMRYTENAAAIRKAHSEYKAVGGAKAAHDDMDAGHFGIALGQHPSIAMEQDRVMNRYGAWRKFERSWYNLSKAGHNVNIKAAFVDDNGEGTYSPFWCIRETINDEEYSDYNLTNDDSQS